MRNTLATYRAVMAEVGIRKRWDERRKEVTVNRIEKALIKLLGIPLQ